MKLPHFLVIGAEKSGTTWLHARLGEHPDVFLPATKEIHFFNDLNSYHCELGNYAHGLDWYSRFFEPAGEHQIRGEVTPLYLPDSAAAERIKNDLPRCRLIAVLRNPIHRAYSHFWMAHNKQHLSESFAEVVRKRIPWIIDRGLYGSQIQRYLGHFPDEQLRVFDYEKEITEPVGFLNSVSDYVGLSRHQWPTDQGKRVFGSTQYRFPWLAKNQSDLARWLRSSRLGFYFMDGMKKLGIVDRLRKGNSRKFTYPPMDPLVRDELRDYYYNDIKLLARLTGLSFDHWLN